MTGYKDCLDQLQGKNRDSSSTCPVRGGQIATNESPAGASTTTPTPARTPTTPTPTATPTDTPTPTSTPTNTPTPTATPDLSWIDPYVQGIANQLLAQRPNDAIAIAIVTEDLRQCLTTAVQRGASPAGAKAQCVGTLNSLPTLTPIPAPTAPPPPVCPGPPVISSFTANPSTINAGQSTTLSWGLVTNATAVYLEGNGVATPGSATDKPTSTKTYTLRAVGCGGTTTRQVTVTVNQAPPPAPSKFVCGLTVYDSTSKGYVKRFTLSRSSPGVSLSGNSTDGKKVTGDCFINQYGAFECDVLVGTCKCDYSTSNIGQYPTENEGYTVSTSPGCVAPYEPWRIEMKWCNP